MPPVKNPCVMTSYGGIIRIRLKGRSSVTSSQPASTSSPVFISLIIIHPFSTNARVSNKQLGKLEFVNQHY